MLPREHRLTSGADFRVATRRGRRAGSRTLVVHLWSPQLAVPTIGEPGEPARAGFVVSKMVGNAVVRNRVKRRLRHLVRESLSRIPDSGVLVVRALPASAEASYAELDRDLSHCLRRVRA
ncbi:MAG: ribonuclease P protein component [Nocardioides sp.]|nr:ribonuclease P protein component [Nocardioides sp.]